MRTSRVTSPRWPIAATLLALGFAGGAWADDDGGCVPDHATQDQLVVELNDGANVDAVMAEITALYPQVRLLFALPDHDDLLISVPEPLCESAVAQAIMGIPGVEEVEFNEGGEISNGQTQSFFFGALPSQFDSQYAWPLLRLEEAHQVTVGKGVVIAIIDTGLDQTHSYLADCPLITGYNFIGATDGSADGNDGLDNDGDGAIDEMTGHGTFLAGIVHTIAPAATILPLRAMDSDGQGETFAIAAALAEAIEEQADVINLSFGSTQSSDFVKSMIDAAVASGAVVVVSGGNTDQGGPLFPASLGKVLAVAATDANDVLAPFSAVGTQIDLCAPGIGIVSTTPGESFAIADGTSVAAAFATGAAALVKSLHPEMTQTEVRNQLKGTAKPIYLQNPGFDGLIGTGRLDLARAVGAGLTPDLDGNGVVGASDLGILLSSWGTANADLDGDGTTNAADLSILIAAWSF